ncbi:acyl carrier protein [Actinophytocola sp.]|uniref:acyl carrier protein n=1 Tax=Actinophytocola sp. TaxID=1872138 RepID=UPI0038999B70
MPPVTATAEHIRRAFAARVPPGRNLDADTNFFEAGFTSAVMAELLTDLNASGVDLVLVDLFRYPTLRSLTEEMHRRGRGGERRRDARRMPWER